MVIMDPACGLLAYEEVPAMEHMGLFGVEADRPPAPVCGVGQQQVIETAFGIAGEPGPRIDELNPDGGMERAEDGGDGINIQPARVSLCIQPLERGSRMPPMTNSWLTASRAAASRIRASVARYIS